MCFFLLLFECGQIDAVKDWRGSVMFGPRGVKISLHKSNYLSPLTGLDF